MLVEARSTRKTRRISMGFDNNASEHEAFVDDSVFWQKLATLKAILFGSSMIDEGGFWIKTREEADRFLRLNQFDTDNPLDLGRLKGLQRDAMDYLTEVHHYKIPRELENIASIHDLFLAASGKSSRTKMLALATRTLRIAGSKGVLPKTTVSRRVSRMVKAFNRSQASA